MALSQIQCLDDNHVNPRTNESKPEFLYCEDQRLALETLLRDGREAFFKYLEARGLRGFLSDPELESLAGAVEPYDPGSELFPGNAEDDETPLSLHYWPDLSDTTVPQMDLGWPDSEAYRGVTRTTMYSQPPLDGQTHVKEIVRKMIAQAQRVIAVVMDIFTDVDIFRDLLDAGFKRKVSVYILLDRTTLPHFLSMCQRANMHSGHLKHLRVRCIEGAEFYTRSSTKVRGRMGHRFMFIDGDKAVSGSYSFTWMSSRLDRNLITVVTGHAVDAFDRLFRCLYVTSSSVDLQQVATAPEPEPEPLPQPASVAPPSAEVARKLYNPKYALVALGYSIPSPSAGHDSPKETQNPGVPETKKRKQTRASKEAIQEAPPSHPGLSNLEKACLMSYLPTWPEPDPPSDVIGFINIRDASKPTQVHLQRSEMFETSQAIRFSSPINMPEESLPEVAKPRRFTTKPKEMKKLQPAQDKSKAEESEVARAQPTQPNAGPGHIESKAEAAVQKSPASEPKCQSNKDTNKTLNTENKLHSNTPTNQDANHNTTPPHLNAQAPPESSSKASTPNTVRPTHTSQTVPPASPQSGALPGSNTEREAETTSSTTSAVVNKAHGLESKSNITCSNSEQRTQKKPHADSHIQTPAVSGHVSSSSTSQSVGSASLSENNHVSITTSSACVPSASISSSFSLPSLTPSSTTLNSPLPLSSASFPSAPASTPPIPKPRTIQLVLEDGVSSDGQKMPDFSAVQRPETSSAIHNKAAVATVAQTSLEKERETVPDLQKISGNTTAAQKDAENAGNVGGAPQQSGTFRETKIEEAVGPHVGRAGMQSNLEAHSDVSIADAPKAESLNIREVIPKEVEPMSLTSDCKLTPQIDSVATVQMEPKAPERSLTGCEPKENGRNTKQRKTYHAKVNETQRIAYCELTPQEIGASETVNSTHTPVSITHNPRISKDSAGDRAHTPAAGTRGQQVNPRVTPADSVPNAARHNAHSSPQEPTPKARGGTHTPEKTLRLQLSDTHMPDLRSPTPERESRLLAALARTPTPDAFPVRTATPDSRTHTPDFQTPTPDISDGYVSPREDSTTSEEYYECCDSPLHDPVFDQAAYRSQGTTEERVSLRHARSPNATSPNACAATLGPTERNASDSETQSSSSSSLLEKEVKIGEEEEEIANGQNGREEEDEKGRKVSVAERRTEGESPGTERRGSEKTKRAADLFKQGKASTETIERTTEVPSQAPKRKKVLNQSAAKRLSDGGVTPARLTNEEAESRPSSTGDLKLKKVSAEGERPDKEKAADRVALGPSGVERRDRPRETEGQKLLHTPPRPPRLTRPPRPLPAPQPSGPRPWGSSKLNQAESKALQGSLQVVNNSSPPRIAPSRPPPPVAAGAGGSAAGRKQAEVSRQPVAAQGKARAGQSQNQHPSPKPQTHSNPEPQLHQPSHKQVVSAHNEEGQAPFSFSLSRLYSLKGMKDKMSKVPAQSKRGRTSSPVQRHKSTS